MFEKMLTREYATIMFTFSTAYIKYEYAEAANKSVASAAHISKIQ